MSKLHDKMKPLCWFVGEWKSVTAVMNYPSLKYPVNLQRKLSIVSTGRPFLNYKSMTWNNDDGKLMRVESGFFHMHKDGKCLALIAAHDYGITTIEEGKVKDTSITTSSTCVGHIKCITEKVVAIQRCYKLNENGRLTYRSLVETDKTPLSEFVNAVYRKCT